jgi:hypothetical protein
MVLSGQFVQAFGTAAMDLIGAQVCDFVTGATGGFINLRSWSAQLRTDASNAINGTISISQGVTGPITGTASSNPSSVQPAVTQLNNQVQISSQAANIQVFNASGIWTKPTGAKSIEVHEVGGGGGGARGSGSAGSPGGGGGAGGYNTYTLQASDVTSTVGVNVGLGSAGGAVDNQSGGTGGTSVFGSYSGGAGGGTGGIPGITTSLAADLVGAQGFGNSPYINPYGGIGGGNSGTNPDGQNGANGIGSHGGAHGTGGGAGSPGTSPGSGFYGPGSGGGGGDQRANATAGAGGAGGFPGGAGGGGGAYITSGFCGNGGAGAAGQVVVITHFS